ncbi:MAG: HD domain-containing protein [Candidatus Aenigmatarchaeota archaeon]
MNLENKIENIKDLNKDERKKIRKLATILKRLLRNETTGHDYWHAMRVLNLSLIIAEDEKRKNIKIDALALILSSLLHDVSDWKLKEKKVDVRELLKSIGIDNVTIKKVLEIIREISFKGALVRDKPKSIEAKILQDADRLDALGAIGIARCFATGAKLGKVIYDPEIKPKLHKSFVSYKRSKSTSINHFYEKLLLLRRRMNTKLGKQIAKEREEFMRNFLKRFFLEFEAKDVKN